MNYTAAESVCTFYVFFCSLLFLFPLSVDMYMKSFPHIQKLSKLDQLWILVGSFKLLPSF